MWPLLLANYVNNLYLSVLVHTARCCPSHGVVKITLTRVWSREDAQSRAPIAVVITEIKIHLLEVGSGLIVGLAFLLSTQLVVKQI